MAKFSTRDITTIIVCSILYTIAIAITAPIPTPWGVGQFRPGVVVPAFFAVTNGAWVAGLGAGIGTFIGSFILSAAGSGLGPIGSLVSGSPGNFIGFYILGWVMSKYKSWRSFILGSFISILIGNLVAATGVMVWLTFFVPRWAPWSLDVKMATIIGLTLFWVVTMQPFVVTLVPILVKAMSPFISKTTKIELTWNKQSDIIYPSIAVALVLAALFACVILTPLGDILFAKIVAPQITFLVKLLFLITAAVMIVFGFAASMLLSRTESKAKKTKSRQSL